MSLFGESQIVFNIILDIVILKHNIGFASGFGIFLIASSLTSNILKKSPK
jgi:drug/metabolite transporter (DMT)-like permease